MKEKNIKSKRNYIRVGIRLFLIITITVITVIFWHTIDEASWKELKNINLNYFLMAALAAGLAWILDGLRIWILSKALGYKISLWYCIGVNLANLFVSTVTPFQSGGAPLQIYMLNKKGVPVGKALTIGLVKWLILMVLFSVISTIVFFSKELFLVDEKVFQVFKNVIIFVLVIVIMFMLSGFFPFFYKKLISKLIIWICKIKFLRKYRNKMLRTINGLIEEFHTSFISFTNTNKIYLFLNMIVTIFFMICYALVAVFLMAGLGKINIMDFSMVWQIMILQIFLIFVVYFSPTPGASGTMEAGFALLFISIASKSMIGFVVLFWRIFTNFIPVILGGFFILKFFSGKSMVKEIKTTIEIEREKIKEEFEKVADVEYSDSEEK